MANNDKKIRNPGYLWMSRIAFWAVLLFTLPLFFIEMYKTGTALSNTLILLFHCYVALGNYILGYRLDDPPKWASWLLPSKWIIEWRYLVYADPEAIKANRKGLVRVIAGTILLTILALAFISDKL
jgi:hypothetical protein